MSDRIAQLLCATIDYIYDEVFQDTTLLVRALRDMGFDEVEILDYAAWIDPETVKEVYEE